MIRYLITQFNELNIDDIYTDHETPNGKEEIVVEIYPTNKYDDRFIYEFKKYIGQLKRYCKNVEYDIETFQPSVAIYITE